jgi:hypothetical protein
MTTDTTPRYVCKGCGAESPTGIGYVAGSGRDTFPDPRPGCPGPHVEGSPPRLKCSLATVATCDPASPETGCQTYGCEGHAVELCPLPAAYRVTVEGDPWPLQYTCHAHRAVISGALPSAVVQSLAGDR